MAGSRARASIRRPNPLTVRFVCIPFGCSAEAIDTERSPMTRGVLRTGTPMTQADTIGFVIISQARAE